MQTKVEMALIGTAVVYLSFFSWPVPKFVKDVCHTGLGRLVLLSAVAYLAKYQSVPLALILSLYYAMAVRAAYTEAFESGNKDDKKDHVKTHPADPSRASDSGNKSAHKGSSAGAKASESGKTEHYQNFASF